MAILIMGPNEFCSHAKVDTEGIPHSSVLASFFFKLLLNVYVLFIRLWIVLMMIIDVNKLNFYVMLVSVAHLVGN